MPTSEVHLVDRQPRRDWLVAAFGAALSAAAVGHFRGHGHGDPMVVAATVVPALGLLAYGVWFWRSGPRVARGDAVFAWAVGGAGAVLALDLWAMAVGAYGAGAATDHVFIQHTSVGALAAAVAGTYSDSNRQQSRAHDRLRDALDAAMDGVAVLDDDGRLAYANDAFCEAYGADDPVGVLGTHYSEYYPTDARARVAEVVDALDAGEREHWHGTLAARREDGSTFPQELSVVPLADGGYVWVARDVTGREARDQRLRVLNRVLRHNVRNALNVVLGRAERLADRLDGDEDVESVRSAAEGLLAVSEKARVVERVLDEDNAETVALADVVAAAVERARSRYPDARFDVDVEAGLDAAVDERLRLAVRELLANAVEHNDAAVPTVAVEAFRDGDEVAVSVSDNGPGIPEQEQRALAGATERQLEHGSGIGLWVVYWVTRQCGAAVDVADDATVVVRTPADGSAPSPAVETAVASTPH
ncbi:PAS domain-containing sensor histidine kinase [Halobacterium yunchengense]|uniref:PAS domain-containing sensor histidine kinase n=1 Tax=Halobacterium yunchengense TaxID=3108497 RepID=UPI00300AB11D